MKPKSTLRSFLSIATSAVLTISYAQAANLYWDGTSSSWNTNTNWSTVSGADTPDPAAIPGALDDAIFNITTVNGAQSISLDADQAARSLTFNNTGTTTLLGGGSARTLTLGTGGITIGASAGAVTLGDGAVANDVLLSLPSGAQTWTNNSAADLTINNSAASFTRAAGATLLFNKVGAGNFSMSTTVLPTDATGIIGNWASFGTGSNTRYAFNNAGTIADYTGGTAAATAANVTDNTGTFNYDVAAVGTLGAGANINTLRYTGAAGTIAGALTTNGIMNVGGGALVFSGAMTSGSGEMVIHAANGGIQFSGGLNNSGNRLTITGSGNVNFSATANKITGAGGLTMNGTGLLTLAAGGTNPGHDYTGTTVINSGTVMIHGNSKSVGNFTLNGGMLTDYYQSTTIFTSGLGSGNNQIQMYGDSGFGGGNGTSTWRIGAGNSVLKWGTLAEGGTGFFNPTTLKFLAPGADNMGPSVHGLVSFNNGLDLNGAVRTIAVQTTSGTPLSSTATITGTIVNTNGVTVGGLTKTGAGNLILSNTGNTYNGATTITAGTLSAAGTGSLGNSSATNTLIFNGGTLRATGTITSVATRGVTMTSTGIIDNNGQAISIAGNIGGTGGLTKNGANTLTLSGTNSYGGVTTVNAGTLAITKEASLASNTAANLNVKSGATLQLNVDSAGTAGFNSSNLSTLLGNISVANTAAQGLQAGATLSIDTSTATGATFTQGNAITNSTGAFGGVINLTKLGAGTLVLDKANTYTGITTISAGTIQLSASGVILGSIVNNGILLVDKAATVGTDFPASISGSGSVAAITGATVTISSATALQNIALNTTGAGGFILSGVTTPVFGGLTGATGDLATVISSGYSGVTNLTLYTQSGAVTYGGVIADGATGMDVTKTGAGTQVLQGANTYTGDTFLNAGTLTLSGAAGALTGTTGITFNGGGLTLTNADNDTEDDLDRVNDSAAITSNGGTITYTTTTAASARTFIETLGSVALTTGQLNLVNTLDKSAGSQTLALSGLTHTGATNTSAITFSNAGGLNLTNDRIRVNGITTDTAAGEIIGAWATVGTAAGTQTDYAVYDSDGSNGYVVGRNTTGSAESTWSTDYTTGTGTLNNTLANASGSAVNGRFTSATRNVNSVRNTTTATATTSVNSTTNVFTLTGHAFANGDVVNATGTAGLTGNRPYYVVGVSGNDFQLSLTPGGAAVDLTNTTAGQIAGGITLSSGFNLGTYGILNGSTTAMVIGGNNGSVTLPTTTSGNLFVTPGAANIAIGSPITNNGAGVLTLVKNGSNSLLLSGTNTYTGGTVINSGTLAIKSNANLGATGSAITFNGSGVLSFGNFPATGAVAIDLGARPMSINNGAVAGLYHNWADTYLTISGNITGDGGIIYGRDPLLTYGGGSGQVRLELLGQGNTFTGPITFGVNASENIGVNSNITVNSLGDSTNPITFNIGGTTNFNLGASAAANLSLPNRPINLLNSNITIHNLSGSRTMTLGAVSTSTTSAQTLKLAAGGFGGFITGNITNGNGSIAVEKSGTGTWTLSGTNPYTGTTTVSGGTLAGTNASQSFGTNLNGISLAAAGTLSLRNDSSVSFTNGTSAYNIANSASGATINVDRVTGTGSNTITVGNLTTTSTAASWGLNFTGANGVSLNAGALSTPVSTAGSQVHTITNNIAGGGSLTLASVFNQATTVASPDLSFVGTGTTIVSGAITQTLADMELKKSGAGSLLLNGTNTYTGLTTVSAGTLGGTGSIAGAVTVAAAGSLLAPDAVAGTLSIGGILNISAPANGGAGKLNFELGPIANSDKIALTGSGSLTIGGAFLDFSDFNFTTLSGLQNGTYKLITSSNAISGTLAGSGLSGTIGVGGTGTLQIIGNDLELVVSGIISGAPEIAVDQGGNIDSGDSKGFGTVTLGSNNSLIFTISNSGTGALNLTGSPDLVAVSGVNAADFTVTAVPTTPVTSGGGTTTFTVQFAPLGMTGGLRNAVLTILNNDSDEGTFTINVNGTAQTLYQAWAGGATFSGDANGDGVSNGLAFLLGASGPNVNALSKLPTVTESGGGLVMTFDMLNAASRGTATLSVEHSSDLGIGDAWEAAAVPDVDNTVNDVVFDIEGSGPLDVQATIPVSKAAGGKLFGRLKATE